MKTALSVLRVALATCAVLLASCARSSTTASLPPLVQPNTPKFESAAKPAAGIYQVIRRFNGTDGAHPDAGMIAVDGALVGTTEFGGNAKNYGDGAGVVFTMAPDGSERILHKFRGDPDGALPNAGLSLVDGLIYGTTKKGGAHGLGAVFKVSLVDVERVIYSFKGGEDGERPHSALLNDGGLLYGTTFAGGHYGSGVAYVISKSGSEVVFHSFGENYTDGVQPNTGFSTIPGRDNKLYSLTYGGGIHRDGVAYSLTFGGTEHVLHNFGSSQEDGSHPYNGNLLYHGGVFYGTTCGGGAYGDGTVFIMSPSGQEHTLFSFGRSRNGPKCPQAGLVLLHNVLYGTTYEGGQQGFGTLFSVTLGGRARVVHTFGTGSSDGTLPASPLTVLDGSLYGTTYGGGGSGSDGTVYRFRP